MIALHRPEPSPSTRAAAPADLREPEAAIDRPWLIDAHLMHAAMASTPVVLERLPIGTWIGGRLDLGDDFAEIGFVASHTDRLPAPGAEVRLRYWMGAVACELQTEVLGHTSPNRARLARPRAVRCTDRRLLLRVAAAASGGWTLIWGPADRGPVLPVLDLSAGGAACALPPGLELGSAEAEVWVHLPGTAPITASAELRRRWTHQGQRMVGLAFGPMAPAHLARLTGALLRAHPA